MILTRRLLIATAALAVLAAPVAAHHGWRWTDDNDFELTGLITAVKLGNPHGVLTVDAEGEIWLAEIGQPYRNKAAGLDDSLLKIGTEVILLGQRSSDPGQRVMKAERVTIAGKNYDLYPERL